MALRILKRASNILIPVMLLAFALGWWQLQRMEEKKHLISDFDGAEAQNLEAGLSGDARFTQIQATGRFDGERNILLDNKVHNGQAGVHVFTPFRTATGTTILVNRGWQPMTPDRTSLPDIITPSVPVRISGILAPPPENRQMLGSPDVLTRDDWPKLVTYLEIESVAEALQTDLPDRVLWLDAGDDTGFEDRQWAPSTMTPEHHQAYAVQWFALGLAALCFWSVLLWREVRKT